MPSLDGCSLLQRLPQDLLFDVLHRLGASCRGPRVILRRLSKATQPLPSAEENKAEQPLPPSPKDDDFSPWRDPRVVAVCGSTGALMLGHGVASPILPLFANELGASAAAVGSSSNVGARTTAPADGHPLLTRFGLLFRQWPSPHLASLGWRSTSQSV